MSSLSEAEIEYLAGQRLGRLATADAKGRPHVVPTTFKFNPDTNTLDVSGRPPIAQRKYYRDLAANPSAAFVVDDVLPPWKPRGVEIRGAARIESTGGKWMGDSFDDEVIKISLDRVRSWGL